VLRQALETLHTHHPDEAEILRLHYEDEYTAQVIANRLNLAEGTVFRKQQQAVQHLVQLLWAEERRLRSNQRAAMLARLELPSYTQLFGVDGFVQQLAGQLRLTQPPWLIAIEGLGGSGKTAVADALVRQLIDQDEWRDVAWVTVQQRVFNLGGGIKSEIPGLTSEALVDALLVQLFPAENKTVGMAAEARLALVQQRLKAQPHLIVIDNLETQADLAQLHNMLRALAGPTKFLLTTRQRLLHAADVYHFGLPELPAVEALRFVRHEATMRNLPDLADASDADLQPIYATVGGNPLALRLVVGQVHVHTLGRVLGDLKAARGQPIEQLYTHIYRRAWDGLDEPARRTLLILPLVTEQGATFEDLGAISQGRLDEETLRNALDTLVGVNLVDARGGLHERRYTIHSLTRTFLHQQVLRWES
jgi:hypothetical protein